MAYKVDSCPGDDDRLPCWFVYEQNRVVEKFYGPDAEYDARLCAEAFNAEPMEVGCEFD